MTTRSARRWPPAQIALTAVAATLSLIWLAPWPGPCPPP